MQYTRAEKVQFEAGGYFGTGRFGRPSGSPGGQVHRQWILSALEV